MRSKLIGLLLIGMWAAGIVRATPTEVEILWDEWGVPHIYAPDDSTLLYGFGWAMAQNHGDLLLRLFAQARGTAAQYGGAAYLESDQLAHTLDIPAEGAAGYAASPPDYRALLDAFAAGVNAYVAAQPQAIDDTWEAVSPINGADILRHSARSLRYSFVAGVGIRAVERAGATAAMSGSNAWALAPQRTASGHAMLVANPHQPWTYDFGLWMEAHFSTPTVNLYGAALIGSPFINIGFNDHLGWTHTVNTHDGWDLYRLTLTPDGSGYVWDGAPTAFTTDEAIIQVRQPDGTLRAEPLTIRRSLHGPVLAWEPASSTALALRIVGDASYLAGYQWWQMGQARNLAEFEAALEPLAIPMFTIMYADRTGNILHVFNELIPRRTQGDWAFWNNTTPVDRSQPAILPGDTAAYLWTTYHTYAELPKVLNPPTGWLQNANEPPWTTTVPTVLDPATYPPYLAPPPFVWPRPTRSMRLLAENDAVTFERLIEMRYDTRMELADQLLPDLLAAAANSDNRLAQQAAAILSAWDRRAHKDSIGGALFTLWAINYVQRTGFGVYAVPFDFADPLHTPRGLADPAAAVEGLAEAARLLEATRLIGGGMDVPYGEAFRLRFLDAEVDLPASGGVDVVGTFSTLTFDQAEDLRFVPVAGDSFIAVIEFGDPVRAAVLLTYGNSTQPGSPHKGDQLALFSDQTMRPALLTREQVIAAAVRTDILTVTP